MDNEETMVVEETPQAEADDTLQEGLTEAPDESEHLDSVFAEEEEAPAEEPEKPEKQGTSEPGWIKQRVQKAVDKALAEQEAKLTAMFEERMRPIREKMIEDEAQELVRSRKVADIETARELVRFRQGQAPAPKAEQPRSENGQFAPKNNTDSDPATMAKIDMLKHQAERIRANGGPDVIAEFTSNKEIHDAVINGQMDFYDVAEQMRTEPKKKPPAPMRSPNGASGSEKSTIASMSSEQFERLERKIKEGARYRI